MSELKQTLVNRLIEQIKLDIYDGDTTVLDEILMKCENQTLIQALPEEQWSEFNELRYNDQINNAIEEARRILCDNDDLEGEEDNILQQIKLIEAFANESTENADKYIDWVDDVIVWEKVQNTYTCDEFLEQIGW